MILKSLAKELGIAEEVKFEGSVSEERIIDEMRRTDVFVLASHSEPLGVVYWRRCRWKLRLSARQPAVWGRSSDGVDGLGLLVEPRNVEALAGAMARLQDNPDLRRRLAQAGRPTIINRFNSQIGARTLRERLETQRNKVIIIPSRATCAAAPQDPRKPPPPPPPPKRCFAPSCGGRHSSEDANRVDRIG